MERFFDARAPASAGSELANMVQQIDPSERVELEVARFNDPALDATMDIRRVPMSPDVTNMQIPPWLPNYGSYVMVVGPPKSGKTTWIVDMITDPLKWARKFDRVYFLSPSLGTIKPSLLESLPPAQISPNLARLSTYIAECRGSAMAVLFVIDDLVADTRQRAYREEVWRAVNNRRHICAGPGAIAATTVIGTQVYNQVEARFRRGVSHLYVFRTVHRLELESIYNDFASGLPYGSFVHLATQVWAMGPHEFLGVRPSSPLDEMFTAGFRSLRVRFLRPQGIPREPSMELDDGLEDGPDSMRLS